MKIKVADLEPNPFRKIKEYPIDRAKVEALKTSIKEKTFWDNILVRPHRGMYQIAYGHHRWIALKELNIKEIDVPVRQIDDATMIQIMAEENLDWSTSPVVITETIIVAKDYLDEKLSKYEKWVNMKTAEPMLSRYFPEDERSYGSLRKQKVGRNTLVKFLGGNWTSRRVEDALYIIKDESLDKEALKTIPTMEQASRFRTSVKKHKIPKPTQKKIANKIAKEGIGKRDIPDLVAEHSLLPTKKAEPKTLPKIEEFISDTILKMGRLTTEVLQISRHVENITSISLINQMESKAKILRDALIKLLQKVKEENEQEKERKKVLLHKTV